MSTEVTSAVYWDSSAVLSALFRDGHSDEAGRRARGAAAREALEGGPWRRLNAAPDWKVVRDLSSKWPLRAADLWRLAVARSLQSEVPELRIISFDARLAAAAKGEGLA